MSSSALPGYEPLLPVSAFSYRDVGAPALSEHDAAHRSKQDGDKGPKHLSPQEIEELLTRARAEAVAETQKQMNAQMEIRSNEEATKVAGALEQFAADQKKYFSHLESEVVHLALAIAGRILHREAQVDNMLVAGLVHVALEKLQNGSNVTVRVAVGESAKWRQHFSDVKRELNISVIEDSALASKDCVLETDLGSADFSIESQLKEVEQGFLDVLALRPQAR